MWVAECENFCLHFQQKCTILIGHISRCDGMVDVVDSKSTAGDSVPVRVRSPAPSKRERLLPLSFALWRERTRTHLTPDVRWTSGPPVQKLVASIIFFPQGRKCKSSPVTGTVARRIPGHRHHPRTRNFAHRKRTHSKRMENSFSSHLHFLCYNTFYKLSAIPS